MKLLLTWHAYLPKNQSKMKSKSFFKKCEMFCNAFRKFLASVKKARQTFKPQVAKIMCLTFVIITICACNSVRATVKGGATTTITVTTNNPSTTQVNPNTNTDLKLK